MPTRNRRNDPRQAPQTFKYFNLLRQPLEYDMRVFRAVQQKLYEGQSKLQLDTRRVGLVYLGSSLLSKVLDANASRERPAQRLLEDVIYADTHPALALETNIGTCLLKNIDGKTNDGTIRVAVSGSGLHSTLKAENGEWVPHDLETECAEMAHMLGVQAVQDFAPKPFVNLGTVIASPGMRHGQIRAELANVFTEVNNTSNGELNLEMLCVGSLDAVDFGTGRHIRQ